MDVRDKGWAKKKKTNPVKGVPSMYSKTLQRTKCVVAKCVYRV